MSSSNDASIPDLIKQKTRWAIFTTALLDEPFLSLLLLISFILRKSLGASAFQITLLCMLKPLVSLLSLYWSKNLFQCKETLKSNLILAGLFARIPLLLIPFFPTSWYLIFAIAIYMLFSRAKIPAWMEILKINLPKEEREKSFSLASAIGSFEGMCLAFAIGTTLDHYREGWKWLFFLTALLGILAVFIQNKIPINREDPPEKKRENISFSVQQLLLPWKNSITVLKNNPEFARFQGTFMAGGFGLMLIQPALPLFFHDVLHISFTDLAIVRSIIQGIGFTLFSPLWGRALNRFSFSFLTMLVPGGFALYILCLFLTPFAFPFLYIAYLIYGISQAGSHLIWHLSGPYYSGSEDSSRFSAVNIGAVGVRGTFGPLTGSVLYFVLGPLGLIFSSFCCCCFGCMMMVRSKKVKAPLEKLPLS